jgi:hypothetical protein
MFHHPPERLLTSRLLEIVPPALPVVLRDPLFDLDDEDVIFEIWHEVDTRHAARGARPMRSAPRCGHDEKDHHVHEGGWMQPSRIHHVGLPVSDLDRGVAWYREAVG